MISKTANGSPNCTGKVVEMSGSPPSDPACQTRACLQVKDFRNSRSGTSLWIAHQRISCCGVWQPPSRASSRCVPRHPSLVTVERGHSPSFPASELPFESVPDTASPSLGKILLVWFASHSGRTDASNFLQFSSQFLAAGDASMAKGSAHLRRTNYGNPSAPSGRMPHGRLRCRECWHAA